jgi:hypothetical protein
MKALRMVDECLEAALEHAAEIRNWNSKSIQPKALYFRLKLNGHMTWPLFRSSSLPTFPRLVTGNTQNNNNTK